MIWTEFNGANEFLEPKQEKQIKNEDGVHFPFPVKGLISGYG